MSAGVAVRCLSAVALAAAGLLFIPFMPIQPTAGLDPSWAYAINEAAANGLDFGRDLVFTFGPLGSMYTQHYHPGTDSIMLAATTLFAVGLCAGFWALSSPNRLPLRFLLPLAVGVSLHRDSVFMVLPFIILLVAVRVSIRETHPMYLKPSRGVVIAMAIAVCAMAILPLSKASFGGAALAESGLAFLVLLGSKRKAAAFLSAGLAAVTFVMTWILLGQPLEALPDLVSNQSEIISGYTNAMSLFGKPNGPIAYLLFAATIAIIFHRRFGAGTGWPGRAATLGLLLLLFVLFKAGYVRYGSHQLMSAHALLLLGLVLAAVVDRTAACALVVVGVLGWVTIERIDFRHWRTDALQRIEQKARSSADGIKLRLLEPQAMRALFDRANAAIREANPLPPIVGTADIYPVDLAILFAHQAAWSGRPVLQSYSAYTPRLDALNAAHLAGPRAPANVLFSILPIDERLPSLEDAGSLPELVARYDAAGYAPPYIHLQRRASPAPSPIDRSGDETVVSGRLNQPISVPAIGNVWAKIDVQPTLAGKLLTAVFKLPPVHIALTLNDGRTMRYRYIPSMGTAGFLLSPLLTATEDLLTLKAGLDELPFVTNVRLETVGWGLWQTGFQLRFRPFKVESQASARNVLLLQPSTPLSLQGQRAQNAATTCHLDLVEGRGVAAGGPTQIRGGSVKVAGWAAVDPTQGTGADAVWLELAGPDGTAHYFAPGKLERPDVARVFGRQELKDSTGFAANLDLRTIPSDFVLKIFAVRDGLAYACPTPYPLKVQSAGR